MIIINFILILFKFILLNLILLFQQDSFFMLFNKGLISILFTIILYYLHYYYKQDYKFSHKYAILTVKSLIHSLIVFLFYYIIFIIGFLFIRFYNSNKTLNLDINIKLIFNIITQITYWNFFITIYLLLKYIHYIFIQYIKFHKNRIYYLTFFREQFFEKIFWFMSRHLTIDNILHLFINQNIAYIFYFLGFIHINNQTYHHKSFKNFSNRLYSNLPKWASIFTLFIHAKCYVLHYYFLFITFLYDMFYNYYILENVYKITPYIFLYEIIVRMSKTIVVKNRKYDTFLAYWLYATCFENNDDIITLGDRTWTQEDAYDIVVEYAFNNFIDKEFAKFYLNSSKYDPFKLYNTSYFKVSEKIYKDMKKNRIIILVFFVSILIYS